MANKKISELDQTLNLSDQADFPLSQDNGGEPTTFKAKLTQIATKIAEAITFSNLKTGNKQLVSAVNQTISNLADDFNTTAGSTYAKDDCVLYNGVLYQCNNSSGTTSGTFIDADWTAIKAVDVGSGGGGGSSTFAGLSDVSINDQTLTNGQVPVYNSTTHKWENGNASGGSGGHTILDDSGTALTQRSSMQFKGAYSEDNSTDGITEVNVIRSMTKAEFDNLPANEKQGIINITDITSGSDDRFQPVIYSEEEREIGVWIDGKPLYQRTVELANITIAVNGGYSYDISSWNVDTMVKNPEGFITLSNDTDLRTVSFGVLGNYAVDVTSTRSAVQFSRKGGDLTCNRVVFTLTYTKTTDQAGSGQWTPQGVPAVHYSTDEQVVGTWIDGSTIYEKTFTASFTNIPSGTVQNVADISGLGINEIISSVGVCKYSAGGTQPDLYESLGLHFYSYIYPSGYLQFAQTMTTQTTGRAYDLKITIQYTKSST